MRFLFSLRVRLLLLVLLAIIPALGSILYLASEQRNRAAADVEAEALRLTRLAASNHDRLIEGARQLLVALAQLPEVRQGEPAACNALFGELLKEYRFYTGFTAVKPNGDVFCSAPFLSQPINLLDRAWYQRLMQTRGFVTSGYLMGRISGKAAIVAAYPVLDAAGQIQAVVAAGLDLAWFNQLAAQAQLPQGAALTVIDHTGVILARYPEPEKWVGESLPETPLIETILAQGEGTVQLPGVDGVERLYAFTPLGSTQEIDAYVSIGISREAAFADVDRALAASLMGLAGVAVLALGAVWFGGDAFILRRVNALLTATRRLAAGDLSTRTGLAYGQGEVSELARAFDEMADTLQRREAERTRAEREIRRLNAELERRVIERTAQLEAANKELEAFSYSVSHDLRAPLRSIDGFSQVLLEDYADRLDETGQNYLRRVCAASQRMARLIDDLLQLSRVTRAEMRREQVDLTALARAVAAELQKTQPGRQAEFVIADGLAAEGDAHLLRVVLDNLLGNAAKFTGKQSEARIEFGIIHENEELVFFVRDNGAGFDMVYAHKLFGAFQRLHAMGEFPGIGIGLATVQRIIHRHGGRVWAEGAVGKGAAFYFTLG